MHIAQIQLQRMIDMWSIVKSLGSRLLQEAITWGVYSAAVSGVRFAMNDDLTFTRHRMTPPSVAANKLTRRA